MGSPPSRPDSWIEVSSRPSSSSVSTDDNDEIVTTGLRVQRSRRPHDDYDASESESDNVLTSSNEDLSRDPPPGMLFLHANFSAPASSNSSEDEEEDDDDATALGLNPPPAFTPQPNAFSHPPAQPQIGASAPAPHSRSSTRLRASRSASDRPSRQHRSPCNILSPSYQPDHDAALRASLSTLLSCAAAARGLPKNEVQQADRPERPPIIGREAAQPSSFRLVPESVALGSNGEGGDKAVAHDVSKPAAAGKKRTFSKDRYPARRSRRSTGLSPSTSSSPSQIVSPTVMTWVVGAGVVVLVSAISFSAGYMLGYETGKIEALPDVEQLDQLLSSSSADGVSKGGAGVGVDCGRDAVQGGLRRFRWMGGSGSSLPMSVS